LRDILVLLKRDVKNSFNLRFFTMLVFMLLFQFWFILGSASVKQVRTTGIMQYMAVVFSFNFFGSITALALNYDGISGERESKVLDLILTSGISKKKVYGSKVLESFLISGIFALLYVVVLMLIYLVMSGDIGLSLLTLKYVLPLSAFAGAYYECFERIFGNEHCSLGSAFSYYISYSQCIIGRVDICKAG
jgi:ABC-type transport system involved in multi-copper enzyme maturation permease subunit